MSEGIQSEYADILNALSEMQQAACYAVRRADLRKAEDTILWLDRDNKALREENRRLRGALETIAGYGRNGICPYGCDTPDIAQMALDQPATPTRDGGEG